MMKNHVLRIFLCELLILQVAVFAAGFDCDVTLAEAFPKVFFDEQPLFLPRSEMLQLQCGHWFNKNALGMKYEVIMYDVIEKLKCAPCKCALRQELLANAAVSGDVQLAGFALYLGANINEPDETGRRPLHYAAEYGQTRMVTFLLGVGAAIDATTTVSQQTPLHYAAQHNQFEVAALLLQKGASTLAKNRRGETPRALAFANRRDDLIERFDDAMAKERHLDPLLSAALDGDFNHVLWLLERGANVRATGGDHAYSALHYAALGGDANIVSLLLNWGVPIGVINAQKVTPLQLAAAAGHYEVAVVLLRRGADEHAQAQDGSTPLSLARANRHTALVALLERRS